MSEQTIKLIQLLKEGKTSNELCAALNISNKQLFNNLTNLRNKGFLYKRKYYSNGVLLYKPITNLSGISEHYSKVDNVIITANNETNFKCIIISDLHFGNELVRLDLIERVYNYCIENKIHIIFCAGDMIDGTFSKGEQKIKDTLEQIEYFIKNYPFDRNILTFCVGGDHDMSSIHSNGQDIMEIARNYRHDIIVGGYNNAIINVKNDKINLHHHISGGFTKTEDIPLKIYGHYHKYATKMTDGKVLNINVPSLSDINKSLPTAVEMELEFNKGYIRNVNLKQIYFGDKNYILNEMCYELKDREVTTGPISHEEATRIEILDTIPKENLQQKNRVEEKVKVLTKNDKTQSQVEKFYKK